MTKKLSMQLIEGRLLAESEEVKASYDTMKAPDGRSKKAVMKDPSGRTTKIAQVTVPAAHKSSTKKSSGAKGEMGIPAARLAGDIVDDYKVPKMSTAKNQKSPATPNVERMTPNQTSKMEEIKSKIRNTEGGKTDGANVIPAAEMAGNYVKKMPHGGATMKAKDSKVKEVNAGKAKTLNGTTRPARKAASMKTIPVDSQTVAQVNHPSNMTKAPADAPGKISWEKNTKGHNVMESMQVVLNGQPKAQFGVVSKQVLKRIVENYRSHGFDVKLRRGAAPEWKKDRALIALLHESVDAHYNNAPQSAQRARKAARDRFFSLCQGDYNNMYESRREFTKTLAGAFDRIMEAADLKYRKGLKVMEGYARIIQEGELVDVELITQARDEAMALRQFRDEIVENFGFSAKVKHIFVEGAKFGPADIVEWAESKKVS